MGIISLSVMIIFAEYKGFAAKRHMECLINKKMPRNFITRHFYRE